jgi:hypothetical protein
MGLALCWWVPLGMVVSLAGLIVGIIGLTRGPVHTTYRRIAAAAALFCLAVLIFDFALGANGPDLITFARWADRGGVRRGA